MAGDYLHLTRVIRKRDLIVPVFMSLAAIFCIVSGYFGGHMSVYGKFKIPMWILGIVLTPIAWWTIAELHPSCTFLKANAEGLQFREHSRSHSYRWSDIEKFGLYSFGPTPVVGIVLYSGRRAWTNSSNRDSFNAIITNGFGRSADELLLLLNEWKTKFTRG